MNSSVYDADRATYFKIVAVAAIARIAIVGFAVSGRINSFEATPTTNDVRVYKAEVPSKEVTATPPARGWL